MSRITLARFAALSAASLLAAALSWAKEVKLDDATIADIHAAYKAGTLTAEKLTQLYLARIEAYDKKGPTINTVITLNPNALAEAKALDASFKAGKIKGPLHGIPVVLKDNFDTFDLPTTGGSQMLEGSLPPDDAYTVKKMRDAGAIILAKLNLSEFAGGGGSVGGAKDPEGIKLGTIPNGFSSAGGQTLNPHDLARGPAGSSGGTGAALAATFAQVGMGTDTGGSVRGPSSVNGIVGLKPTHGLLSRDGIIPLALTFDTGGPMGRSVYDVAVYLGTMTGVDPADDATKKSAGVFKTDYTPFLKKDALKGARLGLLVDYLGRDEEVTRVIRESAAKLKELGATVVEVKLPDYVLTGRQGLSSLIMASEFKAQIADYLKTTSAKYPKTLDDLIRISNDPTTGYRSPEKAYALKYTASQALDLKDPVYLAAKNQGLALITAAIDGIMAKDKLDALIYPTSPFPARLISPRAPNADSPTSIANQTGYPDLIVPAGFTKEGLPVTLSFFGPAFSEPKLLGYGYAFEQATHARALPKTTPALAADVITY